MTSNYEYSVISLCLVFIPIHRNGYLNILTFYCRILCINDLRLM